MRKYILGFFANGLIVFLCYFFFIWLKFHEPFPGTRIIFTFILFFILWTIIALMTEKYSIIQDNQLSEVRSKIAISDFVTLVVFGILVRYLRHFNEVRFVLIYTLLLATFIEFICGYLFIAFKKSVKKTVFVESQNGGNAPQGETATVHAEKKVYPDATLFHPSPLPIDLANFIVEETNEETFNFISRHFGTSDETLIVSTTTSFNVINQVKNSYRVIINLKRINDFQYINKFFEAVNSKLHDGGIFIDWVETFGLRKKRIMSEHTWGLNYLVYLCDFIFHRVFPKLPVTKKVYFFITKGRNRVLSKAESLGRLYSCGFEIIEEQFIENRLFFVVQKTKEPVFDQNPTYGPIIKLRRIGLNGKIIGVYKLRTMHAYSEYLQGYVHAKYSLQEGGKFKDDFRITTLGRIFRKLWIDELPMLINLIKGDLKLVGVRPLSRHYYNLYTKELQQRRLKFKPGLIPPFYADLPKTLDEIIASENKYLELYEKKPVKTDFSYFFKAMYNIIFKHARSN